MLKKTLVYLVLSFAITLENPIWSKENPSMNRITSYRISTYQREQVIHLLPILNEWVIEFFGKYPYLYRPRADQLINPTDTIYVNEPESLVAIAKEMENIVGIATGISLDSFYLYSHYFPAFVRERIVEAGYDPSTIYYMNYFLVTPRLRDDETLVRSIFEKQIQFAKQLGKKQICFMEIVQDENHPLKSLDSTSPEPWGDMIKGYKNMGLSLTLSWPTLQADGSAKEEEHIVQFYILDL